MELLTNVAKHSALPTPKVELSHAHGEVQTVTSDDGIGGAESLRGLRARRHLTPSNGIRRSDRHRQPNRRPDPSDLDGAMRVGAAEDLFLLRDGLVRLLEAHGHTVIASVETGPAALGAMLGLRPDVAVLDVRLPPTFTDEGLRAALAARKEISGLPVLILSQHVEQLYARELLADCHGGIGYQLKDRVMDADQFLDALDRVAEGGTALDPTVVAKLLGRPPGPTDRHPHRARKIRARPDGRGPLQRGDLRRLFFSEGTISKYTTSISSNWTSTPMTTPIGEYAPYSPISTPDRRNLANDPLFAARPVGPTPPRSKPF